MNEKTRSASRPPASRRKGNVDEHVGERLRQRRAVLDLSLEDVASRIGVSAQQLQKYEAADNRITAGRLFDCAAALDVPITFFFDGMADELTRSAHKPRGRFSPARAGQVSVEEVGELLRLYSAIEDSDIRRKAIEYIASLLPSAKRAR
jgi:transcriptional regulator with XRE-family HTH domain